MTATEGGVGVVVPGGTPTYSLLLAVPGFPRLVSSTVLARLSSNMQTVVLVLFALERYGSPQLAGAVVMAATFPGPALSPLAGALLDRRGRIGLIRLDYAVGAASMLAVAALAAAGTLPPWLLLLIVGIGSLTGPLSNAGARSLYPTIVPRRLWDRANAVDATSFTLATIAGPAVGGSLVATAGANVAMTLTGSIMAAATLCLIGVRLPAPTPPANGLLRDSWMGVEYVARHPVLRMQAIAQSISSASMGVLTVVLPVLVLDRLHGGGTLVGLLWATLGVGSIAGAFVSGRIDSHGRELPMILFGCVANAAMISVLIPDGGVLTVVIALFAGGALRSCQQVAMFSLRQRHTTANMYGRAFAILMSVNWMGVALGSGIAGLAVARSLDLALALGVGFALTAAVLFTAFGRGPEVRRAQSGQHDAMPPVAAEPAARR